jgi:hypothetical protein
VHWVVWSTGDVVESKTRLDARQALSARRDPARDPWHPVPGLTTPMRFETIVINSTESTMNVIWSCPRSASGPSTVVHCPPRSPAPGVLDSSPSSALPTASVLNSMICITYSSSDGIVELLVLILMPIAAPSPISLSSVGAWRSETYAMVGHRVQGICIHC